MSTVIHADATASCDRHPPGDLAIWIFILAELGVFALFFAAYAFARSHNVALFDEFQQHLARRAALAGDTVAGDPRRADQCGVHHVVLTGMALQEISYANKLSATESTGKHGIFLKCVHVFRGFRGHLPGSGSR
jgi:heme/copper-type cytochrome/quinol oxidase subunit 3